MGLIRTLLLLVALTPVATSAATVQAGNWPAERECAPCIRLQFRSLELQLPQTEVTRLATTGTGNLSIDLVPASGDWLQSTSLRYRTQSDYLQELFKKSDFLEAHNIKTPRDYWDALGAQPVPGDKNLALARHIEMIDTASSFTRLTKGALTAYVIWADEPRNRRIYFVIDGDETYYELAGPMSPALAEAVIANARVNEMP